MDSLMTPDVLQSPAVAVLCALEADGFRVELTADGALVIAPRSRLTPERMAEVTRHRDVLKLLLRCCDAGVQARRAVFECQLALTSAPGVPTFLFRPGVYYMPSFCFSCADALPAWRFGRCWRCSLAWRLAVRLPISADLAVALDDVRVLA